LPPSTTINELLSEIAKHHHTRFPVMSETNEIFGIVTLQDAIKVAREKRDHLSVGEVCTRSLIVVFPDNSVAEALEKMNEYNIGRLLVVDRNNTGMLLGIITRSDIMHALGKAL